MSKPSATSQVHTFTHTHRYTHRSNIRCKQTEVEERLIACSTPCLPVCLFAWRWYFVCTDWKLTARRRARLLQVASLSFPLPYLTHPTRFQDPSQQFPLKESELATSFCTVISDSPQWQSKPKEMTSFEGSTLLPHTNHSKLMLYVHCVHTLRHCFGRLATIWKCLWRAHPSKRGVKLE